MHFTSVGTTFVATLSLLSSINGLPVADPEHQGNKDIERRYSPAPVPKPTGSSDVNRTPGEPKVPLVPCNVAPCHGLLTPKPERNGMICNTYFGFRSCRPPLTQPKPMLAGREAPAATDSVKRDVVEDVDVDVESPEITASPVLAERKLITDDDIMPVRPCKGKIENCGGRRPTRISPLLSPIDPLKPMVPEPIMAAQPKRDVDAESLDQQNSKRGSEPVGDAPALAPAPTPTATATKIRNSRPRYTPRPPYRPICPFGACIGSPPITSPLLLKGENNLAA